MTGLARVERCDLSDLPVDQCGCHKHKPSQAADSRTRRAEGTHVYPLKVVIVAKYPGRCPECGERYQVGEMITPQQFADVAASGQWAHEDCAREA